MSTYLRLPSRHPRIERVIVDSDPIYDETNAIVGGVVRIRIPE